MGKYIYIEEEVAKNCNFNPVIKAYQENRLCIIYFPRDNAYYYGKAENISKQCLGVIKNTISKIYPGATEIVQL